MPPNPQIYRVAAYRGPEKFAFVSYAHEDSALVFEELDALVAAGVRFYYDEGIHPGHRWHDALADALERCAVFVFFVTARSVASRNCQDEIAFVVEHDKPLIAVYLEDVELPAGLRLAIGNRQAIVRSRFDETRYRERLLAAIREHVGAATASPVPATAAPKAAPEQHAAGRARLRSGWALAIVAGVIAAGYVGFTLWRHAQASRLAREETIRKIEQLVQQDQYGAAFTLAHPLVADASASDDARRLTSWERIVLAGTPITPDSGAHLSYEAYGASDADWIVAGTTPIEKPIDLPRGVVRIRLEKQGFQTGDFAVANPGPCVKPAQPAILDALKALFKVADCPLALAPVGKLPDDMVPVPAIDEPIFLMGLPDTGFGYDRRSLPAFAISKFEVTNREYKAFVDAGGYDAPAYWEGLQFRDQGRTLDWAEARARFVDRTGRAGPANWELSAYPVGQAEMPVGGISWYEAVAYSRFRHLSLPTIHHWVRAALGPFENGGEIAPAVAAESRFLADGPIEAHREVGLGPWGTFNTAGNAREWVWNFVGDEAAALGGTWSDSREVYKQLLTAAPMSRSQDLGLRLMKSFEPVPNEVLAAIPSPIDDKVAKREPISDDAFALMRYQFTVGARTPTHVEVNRFAESDLWVAEEVLLSFAEDEVLSVYVFLPRGHHGRLQPVLFGLPGTAGIAQPNREVIEMLPQTDLIVAGGRALVIPIWDDHYQRAHPPTTDLGAFADRYRREAVLFFQDGVRTIDYLATRADIDADRLGYWGISFGSVNIGPPLLTMEARIRAAVLSAAGVWVWPFPISAPTMDIVNYAPRIRVPVLMINGRYDSMFPHELAQVRLFDLLGTPAADKRAVLYDGGHYFFPRSFVAKEVNDWFDKYLGPPKRE